MDAKKATMSKADALKLASGASRIIATKGKKVVSLDLDRQKPAPEELSALVVGPSGNLRAPTAWVGKTLLVGFDEGMYREALKKS